MRHGLTRAGVALAVPLLVFSAAHAQNSPERRIARTARLTDPAQRQRIDPQLGLGERSLLDVGGSVSLSLVNLTDPRENSRRLFQPEVSVYARAIVDGAHTFFGRARLQYRAYSEGDSFDERGDRFTEPWIDRYWYEFDARRAAAANEGRTLDHNINLRVGRQFIDWGAGLALSENLYAARVVGEVGSFSIEGLAGLTPGDESVIDFDASRRDFDRDTRRGFFGGRVTYTTADQKSFYVYGLHMPDFNDSDAPRLAPVGPADFDYEATYFGIGSAGSFSPRLLYMGEFVYQIGESQSDPLIAAQTSEDIRAFAARGMLTYLLGGQLNARIELEALFASGDDDRRVSTDTVGGNLSGTDDTAYNSLGFVNTGLAGAPSFSNLMVYRLGAAAFPLAEEVPFDRLQLGVDLLVLNKLDPDGAIDEATSDDRYLGFETDIFLNYRLTSDLAFTGRYGVFFPGTAIETSKDTRHFVFLGVTLNF